MYIYNVYIYGLYIYMDYIYIYMDYMDYIYYDHDISKCRGLLLSCFVGVSHHIPIHFFH